MSEKNIFLDKVTQLFLENGAKTLTMDDIAKAFSISKKHCISIIAIKKRC